MITYSTNWMGPVNMQWFKDRGYTKRVTRTLQADSIIGRKKGEVIEYDEITVNFAGGRIDVYGTGEMYGRELGLPFMRAEDFNRFSDWLVGYKTKTVHTLEQLVSEYEKINPKIRWSD